MLHVSICEIAAKSLTFISNFIKSMFFISLMNNLIAAI